MPYPISPDQMQAIRELFDSEMPSAEIAKQFGIPLGSVIAQKANYTWEKNQGIASSAEVEEDALTTKFGLERDLQRTLRCKIDQLEEGLEIIDNGKERNVGSGRIDITARDKAGVIVVIELKAGEAGREAIGQILSYMGDLGDEQSAPVRGILVAGEFSASAVSASHAVPNLQLKKYAVHFSFDSLS